MMVSKKERQIHMYMSELLRLKTSQIKIITTVQYKINEVPVIVKT